MRQELLDELVSAAQEVCNDAHFWDSGDGGDNHYSVAPDPLDRLQRVVQAISDEAVQQIEEALKHPLRPEEREVITCGLSLDPQVRANQLAGRFDKGAMGSCIRNRGHAGECSERLPVGERRPNYVADLVDEGLL